MSCSSMLSTYPNQCDAIHMQRDATPLHEDHNHHPSDRRATACKRGLYDTTNVVALYRGCGYVVKRCAHSMTHGFAASVNGDDVASRDQVMIVRRQALARERNIVARHV